MGLSLRSVPSTRGLRPWLHRRPSAPLLVRAMAKRKKGGSSKGGSSSSSSKGGSNSSSSSSSKGVSSGAPDPTAGRKGFGPSKGPPPKLQQEQKRPRRGDPRQLIQQLVDSQPTNPLQDLPRIESLGKPPEWRPPSGWDTLLAQADADVLAANLGSARKLVGKQQAYPLVHQDHPLHHVGYELRHMLKVRGVGVDMAEEAARALAALWSWVEEEEITAILVGYSYLAQVGRQQLHFCWESCCSQLEPPWTALVYHTLCLGVTRILSI